MILPNFPYTHQEAFDIAYKGIIEQGGPAWDGIERSCLYRTTTGRKCAIGHLIPDDKYVPSFEGSVAIVVFKRLYAPMTEYDQRFYHCLQRIHDNIVESRESISDEEFIQEFKTAMKEFADNNALVFTR